MLIKVNSKFRDLVLPFIIADFDGCKSVRYYCLKLIMENKEFNGDIVKQFSSNATILGSEKSTISKHRIIFNEQNFVCNVHGNNIYLPLFNFITSIPAFFIER